MTALPRLVVLTISGAVALASIACSDGSPTGPTATTTPLPFARESATMRYYHEPGDTVDVDRQEAFNAWALGLLGVQPPQLVEYRKYRSREAMGHYTGNAGTNGFAEPTLWRFHTIWPFDNHEVVHVYTAMLGRPSDFFNEGIAVSFQADPARGVLTASFNGLDVHVACRDYLRSSQLPLPVSRYVTTPEFRAIGDQVLSYRYAGSFVRYLTERFGLPAVLALFRGSTRDDSLATIRARVDGAFGRSLDQLEADWVTFLRSDSR